MENISKFIIFRLNHQEYGMDMNQISSIEKFQEISKVPHTLDFVKGVINLRGEVIGIIDLKERLGMGTTDYTNQSNLLIANLDQTKVGLLVDVATDVIDINDNVIETLSGVFVENAYRENPMKVAKLQDERMVIILGLENILNHDERIKLQDLTNV